MRSAASAPSGARSKSTPSCAMALSVSISTRPSAMRRPLSWPPWMRVHSARPALPASASAARASRSRRLCENRRKAARRLPAQAPLSGETFLSPAPSVGGRVTPGSVGSAGSAGSTGSEVDGTGRRRVRGRQIPVVRHAVVAAAHQAVVVAIQGQRVRTGAVAGGAGVQVEGVGRRGGAIDGLDQADTMGCISALAAGVDHAQAGVAAGASAVDDQPVGGRAVVAQLAVEHQRAAPS